MYFKSLNNIVYPYNSKNVVVKDIFKRIGIKGKEVNKTALTGYRISDGDTAEILSHKLYGNTRYHWVLYLVNEIIDPFDEWPIPDRELEQLCINKYGANSTGLIHHYRQSSGKKLIVDYDPNDSSIEGISNYQYEFELNEKKRVKLVLRSEYLKDFVKAYKSLAGR